MSKGTLLFFILFVIMSIGIYYDSKKEQQRLKQIDFNNKLTIQKCFSNYNILKVKRLSQKYCKFYEGCCDYDRWCYTVTLQKNNSLAFEVVVEVLNNTCVLKNKFYQEKDTRVIPRVSYIPVYMG